MSAPFFVQASTGATDATGAFTFTGTAVGTVGDIVILHIVVDGTGAISWGTLSATNINALDGTANTWTLIGTFNIGSATNAQHRLYIGRRTSASSAPTFTTTANTSGDDVYGRMYDFGGVSAGTTLATVIENSSAGGTASEVGTSATIADAGVTTLGSDRLALNFVGGNDDNLIDTFAGMTGGVWAEAVAEYAEAGGTDAVLQLQVSHLGEVESGGTFTNAGGQFGSNTQEQQAQSFVAPSTASTWTVVVYLGIGGSPTDDVVIALQADSSGSPSGVDLGVSGSLDVTVAAFRGFQGTISASLTSGNTYWIVLRRTGALSDTNNYNVLNGGVYSGGERKIFDSPTWSASGGTDMTFAVHAGSAFDAGTINGGTDGWADATDGWGTVGFALIGTTVDTPATPVPRHPAINHQNPALLMEKLGAKWRRRRDGIFVPEFA